MSKPGKVLRNLCKRLGVRLTVKRGKKRVYKSVKVLKDQCKRKQKKKKRKVKKKKKKVKRRRRKFGASLATNNPTNNPIDTSWVADGPPFTNIKRVKGYPALGSYIYVRYKGAPRGTSKPDDELLGPEQIDFSGVIEDFDSNYEEGITINEQVIIPREIGDDFTFFMTITKCDSKPELEGEVVQIFNKRDQISLIPIDHLTYTK